MRHSWNFYSSGQLTFGNGALGELGGFVARQRWQRVLVVADSILARIGLVERVCSLLAERQIHVKVFAEGEPEPSLQLAERAVEFARSFAPDAVLGVGGGSNMDLAKAVAVGLTHALPLRDCLGWDKVPGPVLPIICIPTTAGTGSEVSHNAVLTDTANRMKASIVSNYLRPALALVDPELTLSCPPTATANSGIDALTHAVEALSAVDFQALDIPADQSAPYAGRHPLGDCLAEQAIELVGKHLVTAVREPANATAREGMSLAALLAGLAFSNCGVAVVHALEFPLGGTLHCAHGAGCGLLLPHVMRYNAPVRAAAYARVAMRLGEPVAGLSDDQAAERAIPAVDRLRQSIGVPQRLRDLGATQAQLPEFADKAYSMERLMKLNPRRPTRDELLAILQEAL